MKPVTQITDEQNIEDLNNLPMWVLRTYCVTEPMKLELNNGKITGATITHRDYVSEYDGRNNYI
jgi:hypothetical protein